MLGDGAGVGKGRSIAGIIYDNWNQGRQKAIWLSVSNDLRQDAKRDLSDIGAYDIGKNSTFIEAEILVIQQIVIVDFILTKNFFQCINFRGSCFQ